MYIPNWKFLAQTVQKLWPIVEIQDDRRPPSWICGKPYPGIFPCPNLAQSYFKRHDNRSISSKVMAFTVFA
jgi:hypothetical protein